MITEITYAPPHTHVGPYRLVRALGSGGMGEVHEAKHEWLERRFALKLLPAVAKDDEEAVARFLREGRAASRVRHPHIVDVTDLGMHEGAPYLVMELLDGESLRSLITRAAPLPPAQALAIVLPLCSALETLHEAGIVHRDVKPENVMLVPGLHGTMPKLFDFGISKPVGFREPVITKVGDVLGSPNYVAPEQARSAQRANEQSDQFALGVVLFELLSGQRPVNARSLSQTALAHERREGMPLSTLRPDLPKELCDVVQRALQVDASERFGSVRELAQALLPLADRHTRALFRQVFDARSGRATPAGGTQAEISTQGRKDRKRSAPGLAKVAPRDKRKLALWMLAGTLSLALACWAWSAVSAQLGPHQPANTQSP